MNNLRYKWILYIIVFVIMGTIGVQGYWNYKNYLSSEQQLINDVQLSLDTAIETYYSNLAKHTTGFIIETESKKDFIATGGLSEIIKEIQHTKNHFDTLDSIKIDNLGYKRLNDSVLTYLHKNLKVNTKKIIVKDIDSSITNTSLNKNFETLSSKIIVSMGEDILSLNVLDTLIYNELIRKNLLLNYGIYRYNSKDSIINSYKGNSTKQFKLKTYSKSTYLPNNEKLQLHFSNPVSIILKRILSSLLISILLILAVISCLFYLLKIIKHQKQLAEVKNDLISNITHEFKTPIATIGVAIESIKNFNVIDDKEKTKNYLDMSNDQLSKLNIMVEKLLETATLDSENLNLNKEEANITDLINILVNKHQMQTNEKTIRFSSNDDSVIAKVDIFHFENTINNILDNAIKYGGDTINIDVSQNSFSFTISISDNGKTLTKTNKEKIFEKFYRIPKGNTHDIKGFGIGLYYAKKIAEKHGGDINLDLSNELTTFKITLPNE